MEAKAIPVRDYQYEREMTMANEETAMEQSKSNALAHSIKETSAKVGNNLNELGGPSSGGEFLLPRITLKHAGTVGFGKESLDEEEELIPGNKGFKAIMLYSKPMRVLWGSNYEDRDEGEQPLCLSEDAVVGTARMREVVDEDTGEVSQAPELWEDNGGTNKCKSCPYSQGFPQECRRQNRVFLLPEGNFTPHVMDVPRTSINNMAKYGIKLGGKGFDYWAVVTLFRGVPAENSQGVQYTELALSLDSALPDELVEVIQPVRNNAIEQASTIPVD